MEFKMTQKQLDRLLDACQPVRMMKIGGTWPASPQENANMAWEVLGKEMGFDYKTVKSLPSKGNRYFTAEEKTDE